MLGDNILRGAAAGRGGGRLREWPASAPARSSTRSPTPSASASRSSPRTGRSSASRRSRAAQERPHPHRRLLPAPRCLRRHRAPRPFGPRRIRDHRRPQPLHPGWRPLLAHVRGPLVRCRHGRRRSSWPPTSRPRTRRPARSHRRRSVRDRRRAGPRPRRTPPGDRRRRLHRLVLRARCVGGRSDAPDHRPRPAHVCRATGQPSRGAIAIRVVRHGCASSAATSPTLALVGESGAGSRRDRQLRGRVARRPEHRRRGRFPAHRRHRRPRPARGHVARVTASSERRAATAPRLLQVSTDEVYGSVETGPRRRRDRSPRDRPTPQPRPPVSSSP